MANTTIKSLKATEDKGEKAIPPRGRPGRRPGILLRNPQDVRRLLARLINQVMRQEQDKEVLRAISYSCTVLLKSIEQGDLTDRIAGLERIVQRRPN
jgi:hypothetical protein